MPAPVPGVDGNWSCPQCQNVNFAVREACNRCQAPKPPEAAAQYAGYGGCGGKGFVGRGGPPMAGVDGNWACSQCQNVNFQVREACNRCQAPKQREAFGGGFFGAFIGGKAAAPQFAFGGKGGAPVAGADGNWSCPACRNVNFAVREACNRCQAPKPVVASGKGGPVAGVNGNWACPACQNVNYAGRELCNRCQGPKPESTPDVSWICPICESQCLGEGCHACGLPRPDKFMGAEAMLLANVGGGAPVAGLEGNWSCPSCQNVNFPSREFCNRCQWAKPTEAADAPMPRGPVAGQDGNWACPQCQNVNFPLREACNRCHAPKPQEGGFAGYAPMQPEANWAPTPGKQPVAGYDGNWVCPQCQNVNFPAREACNRCQMPKPPPQDYGYNGAPGGGAPARGAAPVAGLDGNWACLVCSNVNFAVRAVCNRCQSPHMVVAPAPAGGAFAGKGAPKSGVDGNWSCPACQNVNFPMRLACNRCQNPKPEQAHANFGGVRKGGAPAAGVDGNWSCQLCSNINFAGRTACNRCQAPLEQAAYAEEAAYFEDDPAAKRQRLA